MKALSFLVLMLGVLMNPADLTRDDREVWDEGHPSAMGSYRYMAIREECLGDRRKESTYLDCVDARVQESRDRYYYEVTRTSR